MFDFSHTPITPRGSVSRQGVEKLFSGCGDLESRSVTSGGGRVKAAALWLDGLTDSRAVSEDVLRPLYALRCRSQAECASRALAGGIYSGTARQRFTDEEVAADLTTGSAAIVFDELGLGLTFEVKSPAGRAVETPTVEKSVLGAKDAFVETLRVNTALVRRRLPSADLKLRQIPLGTETKTRAALLYMEGLAPAGQVAEVWRRLEALSLQGVTDPGELERPLAARPRGAVPQVLHTERPDRFAQGLLDGKVGILADGMPLGLLLPGTLPEMLRTQEDRSRHAAVASALVLLRFGALIVSLLLPALYVAVAMYHQEMIPYKLLQSVIRAKEEVPFSTAAEVIGMLLSFELLQEAGIRLPEPVGQTVSVIGGLIVGQSAVEAKILSPIVIIVVAMAGVASYTQPSQELGAAVRLWRFALVFCAAALGFFGVMAGLIALLWRLCDMENLGVSCLYPLCDAPPGAAKRVFFRPALGRREAK